MSSCEILDPTPQKPLALAFSSSDISAEQASVAARLTEMEGQRSGNSSKLRQIEGDIKQRGIDVTHKVSASWLLGRICASLWFEVI